MSSDYGSYNTKKSVLLRERDVKLSKIGKKTIMRKEKPKATYSVALIMVFLAAENENRLLEDLTQADFVQFWLYVYLKDSYIGKDKVDN